MMFHSLTSRVFTPQTLGSVERRDGGDAPACVRHPSPRRTARTCLKNLQRLRARVATSDRTRVRQSLSFALRALAPIRASRHPRARVSSLILHRAQPRASRASDASRLRLRDARERGKTRARTRRTRPGPRRNWTRRRTRVTRCDAMGGADRSGLDKGLGGYWRVVNGECAWAGRTRMHARVRAWERGRRGRRGRHGGRGGGGITRGVARGIGMRTRRAQESGKSARRRRRREV